MTKIYKDVTRTKSNCYWMYQQSFQLKTLD